MWQFIKDNPFIVGALTGSLAAYLLGLLVSHWRREKLRLVFSVISSTIVERGQPVRVRASLPGSTRCLLSQGSIDLSLRYKNRDIESLHSHTVALKNIGNRPLTKQTVRIELPNGGEIAAHELDMPRGATCTTSTEGKGTLLIICDLLNPGEILIVGVVVVDSPERELAVTARGENLVCEQI